LKLTMLILLLSTHSLLMTAQNNSADHKIAGSSAGSPLKKEPAPFEKAADAIGNLISVRYRNNHDGINSAAAFNALGALAGFGCQMAIREGFIKPGTMSEDKAFVIFRTTDGQRYFFGDFLNGCLFQEEGKISVWSLVAGAAQKAGAKQLPDVEEIVAYNAKTLGTRDFGVPRVPEQYRSSEMPIDVLKKDWPTMQKLLTDYQVRPIFWGWTVALAAQHLIEKNKEVFDPGMAAKITMEAALPMSKVDPATIGVR